MIDCHAIPVSEDYNQNLLNMPIYHNYDFILLLLSGLLTTWRLRRLLATKLLRGGGAAGLNTCEAWHRAENATYASTLATVAPKHFTSFRNLAYTSLYFFLINSARTL